MFYQLNIVHLYPDLFNLYADRGNIIALKRRCCWRNIKTQIKNISLNDPLKTSDADLIFSAGGQDKRQLIAAQDLQKKKTTLKKYADKGTPMLLICASYQLFGHYFKTNKGIKIPGISIFDAYTVASLQRKVGNIVVKLNPSLNSKFQISNRKSSDFNLVGFENHSGNTFIKKDSQTCALTQVIKGFGNNGRDKTEGAVYKNAVGVYLHGPLLPKNPHLADWLIKTALEVKYKKKIKLAPLDDKLEWQTHYQAARLK